MPSQFRLAITISPLLRQHFFAMASRFADTVFKVRILGRSEYYSSFFLILVIFTCQKILSLPPLRLGNRITKALSGTTNYHVWFVWFQIDKPVLKCWGTGGCQDERLLKVWCTKPSNESAGLEGHNVSSIIRAQRNFGPTEKFRVFWRRNQIFGLYNRVTCSPPKLFGNFRTVKNVSS